MTDLRIRCIQIGGIIVQGPCIIALIHNHHLGPEPTGYGTIRDGRTTYTGKLIEQVRGNHQPQETNG